MPMEVGTYHLQVRGKRLYMEDWRFMVTDIDWMGVGLDNIKVMLNVTVLVGHVVWYIVVHYIKL